MKPNELIKILDSGVVHNLRINYCGGRIDVNPKNAPFELPDYEIVKLWADDRGYICILLADGIAAEREPAPKPTPDEKEISDDDARKTVDTLLNYCCQTNCSNCIFERETNDSRGCLTANFIRKVKFKT